MHKRTSEPTSLRDVRGLQLPQQSTLTANGVDSGVDSEMKSVVDSGMDPGVDSGIDSG